jgi:hypothetical protein
LSPSKIANSFLSRPIEPAGTTNQACQPLVVVVLVISEETGAALSAREAAGQRMSAGSLRMPLF